MKPQIHNQVAPAPRDRAPLLAIVLVTGLLASVAAHAAARYQVLKSFTSSDGAQPHSGLVRGSDGALYGTTSAGGEFGQGTVFKLWPPPRLLPPLIQGGAVTLRIVDGPGFTNDVQRATTLDGSWQTLTNLVGSESGVAEFIDPAPPQPNALYRVVSP